MNKEQYFLEAINAGEPNADLIYADWLEEQGRPEADEIREPVFVVLQIWCFYPWYSFSSQSRCWSGSFSRSWSRSYSWSSFISGSWSLSQYGINYLLRSQSRSGFLSLSQSLSNSFSSSIQDMY